eukprot:54665-Eustigmatos_ZCMA.PRE.1
MPKRIYAFSNDVRFPLISMLHTQAHPPPHNMASAFIALFLFSLSAAVQGGRAGSSGGAEEYST